MIFKEIVHYTNEIWIELIELHLKKMNFIVKDDFSFPLNNFSQAAIFSNQFKKYTNVDSTIAVLSAFPIFLFDYYGLDKINKLI